MFQELLDNLTNVGVFTSSVQEWVSTLSINKVIIFIMMIFMIVGAIDKIRGNKLGYGEQFDEGFNAMGPLAAAMAGVVAAAPGTCNHFETDYCSDLHLAGRRPVHVCDHASGMRYGWISTGNADGRKRSCW